MRIECTKQIHVLPIRHCMPHKFLLQMVALQVEGKTKYMLFSESKLIVAADAVEIQLIVTWEFSCA